jgi:hypothetical protein
MAMRISTTRAQAECVTRVSRIVIQAAQDPAAARVE